jgi:hypothetical protein
LEIRKTYYKKWGDRHPPPLQYAKSPSLIARKRGDFRLWYIYRNLEFRAAAAAQFRGGDRTSPLLLYLGIVNSGLLLLILAGAIAIPPLPLSEIDIK